MTRGRYLRIVGSGEISALVMVAAVGCLVWLVGSTPDAPRAQLAPRPVEHDNRFPLSIYTDPESGCQYLGHPNSNAGITARIGADGKTHMGCKRSTQ